MDKSFVPLASAFLLPYLVSLIMPGWRSLAGIGLFWLVVIVGAFVFRPGGSNLETVYGPVFVLGVFTGMGIRAATLRLKAQGDQRGLAIFLAFFGAFFVPVLLFFAPLWVV